MRRLSVVIATLCLIQAPRAFAAEPLNMDSGQGIEVIDIPTAEVVNHYGYNVSFRFGKDGNLQTKAAFGVFPRLNIGFGLDGENIIGTGDSRLNKPSINMKLRMFDGKGVLPALALGYDGQGYVYNRDTDEYEQREKGLFLVATEPIFTKSLELHVGGNMYDFDESTEIRGFLGVSWVYEKIIGLMAEYDQGTEYEERRINFGGRYFITPVFTVDVAGRNVPETPNSSKRETERIVKLSYTGAF